MNLATELRRITHGGARNRGARAPRGLRLPLARRTRRTVPTSPLSRLMGLLGLGKGRRTHR